MWGVGTPRPVFRYDIPALCLAKQSVPVPVKGGKVKYGSTVPCYAFSVAPAMSAFSTTLEAHPAPTRIVIKKLRMPANAPESTNTATPMETEEVQKDEDIIQF